eukprot:TRINITY_DN188_c0_g1_i5.p1 TRINITY_DN188_c0_g1~~TRINITY_DN188_c0_g1_i5.p1  ORF type:complete len:142 (+),score=25.03 TRINITY_DN188_c0_g1_i5:660-1085(+)
MLTNIEAKLEELFKLISCMPPEEVESAEKAKEKSRREKARGEKIEFEKKKQEDKVQRALMRSQAPVMKKTGKPVMFRSAPNQRKKKDKVEVRGVFFFFDEFSIGLSFERFYQLHFVSSRVPFFSMIIIIWHLLISRAWFGS